MTLSDEKDRCWGRFRNSVCVSFDHDPSASVFQALRLLHSILSDVSKPFALHMTALMYHNLGEMMYNVFAALPVRNLDVLSSQYFEG